MIIVVKALRIKAKELGKQINPEAIQLLDRNVDEYITKIISAQKEKRITGKSLQI